MRTPGTANNVKDHVPAAVVIMRRAHHKVTAAPSTLLPTARFPAGDASRVFFSDGTIVAILAPGKLKLSAAGPPVQYFVCLR